LITSGFFLYFLKQTKKHRKFRKKEFFFLSFCYKIL
ncbi:unnamed protein product, partial [Staurois parvus]